MYLRHTVKSVYRREGAKLSARENMAAAPTGRADTEESPIIRRFLPHATPRRARRYAGAVPILCEEGVGMDDTSVRMGVLGELLAYCFFARNTGILLPSGYAAKQPSLGTSLMTRLWI